MKIGISSVGDTIESKIDQRFGRCKYFLIVDIEQDKILNIKAVKNQGEEQGHGAGIKAAQQIGEAGVDTVLTGDIGPNASEVLKKLNITAFHASGVIKEAVDQFIKGNLEEIKEIAAPNSGITVQTQEERIFIPLLNNKGEESDVSQHFGHAPFFGLFDEKTKKLTITENKLEHTDPTKSPVDQIVEAVNPTVVFAQAIGSRAIRLFGEKGISLKTGAYTKVKGIIENLDKLEDLTNSCGH